MKFGLLLFKFIGISSMIGAVIMLCWNLVFWAQADITEGVIVKVSPGPRDSYWDNYEGGIRYVFTSSLDRIKVEFDAADGKHYAFVPGWSDISQNHEIDDIVQILYRPTNPQSAEIYGFKALFFGPIIIFILGVVFWFASLFRLVL